MGQETPQSAFPERGEATTRTDVESSDDRLQVPWRRQAMAFAWRHLRGLVRNKVVVFLAVGWPLAWYFMFVWFIVPSAGSTEGSYAVVKGANAITYAMFGAFTVTVAVFAGDFARDLGQNRYRKLRAMPIYPTADLAGRFTAGLALATLSYGTVLAVAAVEGAAFEPSVLAPPIVVLTLVSFCLIAMALSLFLAVWIPKPEYMTTLAVVIVLIAFWMTGFNGLQPGFIAEDATFINYLPNSMATRMQLHYMTADLTASSGVIPPEMPVSAEFFGLLSAYTVGLLATSIGFARRFVYGRE